jgi:FkbM family methyltransferase
MARGSRTLRLDLVEIGLICMLAAGAAFAIGRSRAPQSGETESAEELAPLARKYGPHRNSEHAEEWILRDFFQDRRNGFFVDVGANHYKTFSNSYYLETALGWSGLAIEPQSQFEPDYQRYRPRTRFRPFFVSDVSNQQATLYYLRNNPLVTSSDKSFTEQYGRNAVELKSPTITLDDLLAREQVTSVDLLSMDIELAEPAALKGFDIDRVRPELVCIEAHPVVRQQILNYFAAHRYLLIGKYLRVDVANLYFAPAGHASVGN